MNGLCMLRLSFLSYVHCMRACVMQAQYLALADTVVLTHQGTMPFVGSFTRLQQHAEQLADLDLDGACR